MSSLGCNDSSCNENYIVNFFLTFAISKLSFSKRSTLGCHYVANVWSFGHVIQVCETSPSLRTVRCGLKVWAIWNGPLGSASDYHVAYNFIHIISFVKYQIWNVRSLSCNQIQPDLVPFPCLLISVEDWCKWMKLWKGSPNLNETTSVSAAQPDLYGRAYKCGDELLQNISCKTWQRIHTFKKKKIWLRFK